MRRLVLFLLIIGGILTAEAQDIRSRLDVLLSGDYAEVLLRDGVLRKTSYREDGTSLPLLPRIALAEDAKKFWSGEPAPFVSETLFLYKKPAAVPPGADVSGISVILRSLSRLEGLEYYSNSRKTMRTLYKSSYAVESEENRTRITDPVSVPADGLSVVAIQEDLTFGEYAYRYDYRQTDDTAAFYSTNIDSLSYGFIRIIKPGNLRIALLVHDLGDYLLVYNLTRAEFLAIPGMEKKLNASFSSRADAVYGWFIDEYQQ